MEILDSKTDIGRIREKNEDAVLSITHPKNKNIKLLIVADGMGGKEKGEIAANYVTLYLHRWFIHKDVKLLNDNNKVIELLGEREEPMVFILWGNYARSKKKLIQNDKHLIIESAHPSPLSAYNGFFGSRPFSKTNSFLKNNGIKEINWQL